jgi:AraC family transcriptional regulator
MKILKWLLYILIFLVALVLIIPLFLPATVMTSAEITVNLSPAQVFHNAAQFTDRDKWDPWLEMDPEADFVLSPQPGYVGSEYTWDGEKIKTGRIVVDTVVFGEYIRSRIYFGDDPEPGIVKWRLKGTDQGTEITWTFIAETAYPVERLMMNLFKGQMKSSFEHGLANLKAYLEENPPVMSTLGEISEGTVGPMFALVAAASGTMDQFSEQMGRLYPMIMEEVRAQGLRMAGPSFCHYLSYDEQTGITEYLCGIPVASMGKEGDGVTTKVYREIPVIQAMHTGPYEELERSYGILMKYIEENGVNVTMEAFEIYLTDPMAEPMTTRWKTLIAMPLN